jgi:hypothetical protein
LEQGTYFYLVRVFDEGITYGVVLNDIKPLSDDDKKALTEEEIADYNSNLGKWEAVGVQKYDAESPFREYYETAAAVSGNNSEKPLLVGSLPYFTNVVALYPDSNGDVGSIVPIWPEAMNLEILGLEITEENMVYEYADIKERVAQAKKTDPDRNSTEPLSGGGSGGSLSEATPEVSNPIYVSAVLIVCLAFLAVLCVLGSKRKKTAAKDFQE